MGKRKGRIWGVWSEGTGLGLCLPPTSVEFGVRHLAPLSVPFLSSEEGFRIAHVLVAGRGFVNRGGYY